MSEIEGLFREIDDDLKQEKLEKIWKKYGNHFIGGIVGIVAIAAIFVFWKDYSKNKRASESIAYTQALEMINKGQKQVGVDKLEELSKNASSYKGLAALSQASALIKDKETKSKGVELYNKISNNNSYDATTRYLAGYYAILNQIDDKAPEDLLEKLPSLMVGANPWSILVTELKAILTLKADRKEEAAQIYRSLLENKNAPSGVQIRAQAALSQIN